MRLTCPRCAAQYEIEDTIIPPAGREVECSACGRVWHQAGLATQANAAPYDAGARPALSRPLDESILSILREEAARELQAREADHSIAISPAPEAASAMPVVTDTSDTQAVPDSVPAFVVIQDNPSAADEETSRQNDNQPGEPDQPVQPDADSPSPAIENWPAATVTETDKAIRPPTLSSEAEIAGTPEARSETAPHPDPTDTGAPDTDAMDTVGTVDTVDADTADAEGDFHEPVAPSLPDAAELAATLTRTNPPTSIPMPAAVTPEPKASEADDQDNDLNDDVDVDLNQDGADQDDDEVIAPPPPAGHPKARAAKSGAGYATGFGLAAMLALGVVTLYALAPRIPPDMAGGALSGFRQEIDRGRLWLHDRLYDRLPGTGSDSKE